MSVDPSQTIGAFIEQEPAAVLVLHDLGVSLAAQRGETLATVCANLGIDWTHLAEECAQARELITPPETRETNWFLESLDNLANYIIERYHGPAYDETERITLLGDVVVDAHSDEHGPLVSRVVMLWNNLAKELLSHMRKEEMVIFPLVRQIEKGVVDEELGDLNELVTDAIASMKNEHQFSDGVLAELRTITDDYAAPPVDCPLWRAWWGALHTFDRDLRMHSHLEDDILFLRMADNARRPTE
jgi:regulator of cell morphogenesis and NO signaling